MGHRKSRGFLLPRASICSLLATAQVGGKPKSDRNVQTPGGQAIERRADKRRISSFGGRGLGVRDLQRLFEPAPGPWPLHLAGGGLVFGYNETVHIQCTFPD